MWYVILPYPQAAIWNIRHCKLKQQLCGHVGAVFTVDLNEKAKVAYTGSGDKVNISIDNVVTVYHPDNQTMGGSQWTMY